ncbi:hypothetical protein, partial [Chromobacterium haemolyticum]|uniref:hypothetical protein n=1 Tax=Chromobacterium haemolyticum TaxID=394935 RepID=UPI001C3932C5
TTSSVCGTLSPAADHRTIKQYHYHANLGLLSLSLVWLEGEDQIIYKGDVENLLGVVIERMPSFNIFK